jgi:chromosome segregation ATPase
MRLTSLELYGFKSFAKKGEFVFDAPITAVVGPNGSGKSNVAESFRFVLGEQSIKSLRGKRGEDLIWGGSSAQARMNRASVKVVFDNALVGGERLLSVDFDEVEIERIVHRDGENEYLINGSRVRLRDVIELLAGANIGASGHHIISQGEADRVLSSSSRERRGMIEDALGLRVYQYKKQESEKKLEKTQENKEQVGALRKENAPHLKFLEKQVKKLERAVELRAEITDKYHQYLKRESVYLAHAKLRIAKDRVEPEEELKQLEEKLKDARRAVEVADTRSTESEKMLELQQELVDCRESKDAANREVGRLEGEISAEARRIERERQAIELGGHIAVPFSEVEALAKEALIRIDKSANGDISKLRALFDEIKLLVTDFLARFRGGQSGEIDEGELVSLRKKQGALALLLEDILKREVIVDEQLKEYQRSLENKKDAGRDAERTMFEIMTRESEVRSTLEHLRTAETNRVREEEEFKRECGEAGALIGREALAYENVLISEDDIVREDRLEQAERRRALEKLKIRLEEIGGGSADEIMREYEEVRGRDDFLSQEIDDLEKSAYSLKELIKELEDKLDTKFREGLTKINHEFNNFFSLMFGGGSARLELVREKKRRKTSSLLSLEGGDDSDDEGEEEEDKEEAVGIEVSVSLPNKKIRGLAMLSGGERALTSIALIFAMSQVNPPPFLILDETDAALDEANSRRYCDMIENLAKRSQLILITHNRETMSRAGVLYGITMGRDGISKLLSVKFEEAVQVAK